MSKKIVVLKNRLPLQTVNQEIALYRCRYYANGITITHPGYQLHIQGIYYEFGIAVMY